MVKLLKNGENMAFQNPAQNYAEQRLNFGDLVTLSPHSTFLLRSVSDYPDTGILKGSILAIDRSLAPRHDNIVVANVDNELVLRRLLLKSSPALQELGGDHRVETLLEGEELPVWGVVAYILIDAAGLGFNGIHGES